MITQRIPIDWQQCLRRANNDPATAETLLTMFVESLNEALPHIHETWQKEQYTALHEHIHKLRGGACYTGAPEMLDILTQLETATQTPTDLLNIATLLKNFDEESQGLLQQFHDHTFMD